MKYAIVIPDGCADEPQASLGGRTPLQAAHKPHMDRLAQIGVVGRSNNVPASLTPASDVATLSLFGYDPLEVYTGRAPLETAAKAPASSMPASRKVSWSKPIPVTRRPPNPGPSRRKAVGSWSITATVCPCCSRDWARAEPTLPQPMMTMCTTVLPMSMVTAQSKRQKTASQTAAQATHTRSR